jgi:hypothetical protein
MENANIPADFYPTVQSPQSGTFSVILNPFAIGAGLV